MAIYLTDTLSLDEGALSEQFTHASGPGGQHVNKVATAVQLRLDLARSGLPEDVKSRLYKVAGRRMTDAGELLIEARRFRSREKNREDALERLKALILRAAEPPKPRTKTKPSRASKRRRMEDKRQRGSLKRLRQQDPRDEG
jgi:ribosome-associated protein